VEGGEVRSSEGNMRRKTHPARRQLEPSNREVNERTSAPDEVKLHELNRKDAICRFKIEPFKVWTDSDDRIEVLDRDGIRIRTPRIASK
jgi:hypothetical protein